jgi:RNA polymerase sigma factor (sigma-70 family)
MPELKPRRHKKPKGAIMGLTNEEFVAALQSASPAIKSLAWKHLGPGFGDDVIQETALRAWRSSQGFRRGSRAETWLYSIARNVCKNFYQQKHRNLQAEPFLLARVQDFRHNQESLEARIICKQFLLEMTQGEQRMIWRQMLCSEKRAAQLEKIPTGTLKTKIHKLRKGSKYARILL